MTHRTSLTPYAASMADPDPHSAKRFARQMWRDQGAVVLMADQVAKLEWQERELVMALAGPAHERKQIAHG